MFIKYKNYFKNKKIEKKGFVILLAIIVSALLVSLGIFIANVATKELILSMSAKTTQRAFFAADSAIECALYQDIRVKSFKINAGDTESPTEFFCNDDGSGVNKLSKISESSCTTNDMCVTVFEGSLAEDQTGGANSEEVNNSGYVRVKVTKFKIGQIGINNDKTTIEAWGHNKKSRGGISERALRVDY